MAQTDGVHHSGIKGRINFPASDHCFYSSSYWWTNSFLLKYKMDSVMELFSMVN